MEEGIRIGLTMKLRKVLWVDQWPVSIYKTGHWILQVNFVIHELFLPVLKLFLTKLKMWNIINEMKYIFTTYFYSIRDLPHGYWKQILQHVVIMVILNCFHSILYYDYTLDCTCICMKYYLLFQRKSLPAKSEKEIFDILGVPYFPPEERNCWLPYLLKPNYLTLLGDWASIC